MNRVLQRRIEKVKDAVSIETVIEQVGGIIQGGSWGAEWERVLCPFHQDNVPSASVNLIAGVFTCHACGVKGDVIDIAKFYLEQMREPATFSDALAWLENLGGIE